MTLSPRQQRLCDHRPADYSDLSAVYLNCTLKRSPEVSHTQGLMDMSIAIMRKNGVAVEAPRVVDHDIAFGVYVDMTARGLDERRLTWNLLHMARMLRDAGGLPAHGNPRSEWDAGCRFDYPNPEHR